MHLGRGAVDLVGEDEVVEERPTLELKTALLQGRYHTIVGEVAFDENGDVIRPLYEVIVKEGRFINNGEID